MAQRRALGAVTVFVVDPCTLQSYGLRLMQPQTGGGRMVGEEHVSVAVRDDFLARQTKAKPPPALAELIWNSLDGDATEVWVLFAHNDLAGGMSKIVVYDNGDGFSRVDARALFGNLGGSWKRLTRQTRRNRRLIHGQEGRGRYKAFALGRSATWKVCYDDPRGRKAFEVRLLAGR
jgi:hypothetical protein